MGLFSPHGAERSEFIEQLFERFAAAFFSLSETVEEIERDGFAVLEDAFGTGHPIGALTDDEVSHDIERAPAIKAFVCGHPPADQEQIDRELHQKSVRYRPADYRLPAHWSKQRASVSDGVCVAGEHDDELACLGGLA